MQKFYRSNSRLIITYQGSFVFGLGLAYYFESTTFFVVSLMIRLVEGGFAGGLEISIRTFCLRLYGHNVEAKLSLLQVATLLGFLIGPCIGAALFYMFGFTSCMLILGIYLILLDIIFIKFLKPLPERLDSQGDERKPMWPLFKASIINPVIADS